MSTGATRAALPGGREIEPEPARVTAAEIEAAKTERGGWTREQLAQWGVPWPPPKGWKEHLINSSAPTPVPGGSEEGSGNE